VPPKWAKLNCRCWAKPECQNQLGPRFCEQDPLWVCVRRFHFGSACGFNSTAIWSEHNFGARMISYLMAHVELDKHRRKMKLFDVCTFFLVAIVCARRYPFPWRQLAAALIAKDRFRQISAVCDLLALLTACDYVTSRISGSSHYPTWISFLCAGYVSVGLVVTPSARSLIASIFLRKSKLERPAKRVLSSP
jgi:hypothetical protein